MKVILALQIILSSILYSLSEGDKCDTNATIIGRDINKCRCCWGWQIKIDDKIYLTDEIPQLDLEVNSELKIEPPIQVKIGYVLVKDPCNNRIIIKCLETK